MTVAGRIDEAGKQDDGVTNATEAIMAPAREKLLGEPRPLMFVGSQCRALDAGFICLHRKTRN